MANVMNGALVCIQMDANAKLGSTFIARDPNLISKNGEKLQEIIQNNDLVVVNSKAICKGVIIRQR